MIIIKISVLCCDELETEFYFLLFENYLHISFFDEEKVNLFHRKNNVTKEASLIVE